MNVRLIKGDAFVRPDIITIKPPTHVEDMLLAMDLLLMDFVTRIRVKEEERVKNMTEHSLVIVLKDSPVRDAKGIY